MKSIGKSGNIISGVAALRAHDKSAGAHLCPVTTGCVGAWNALSATIDGGKIAELLPLIPGLPSLTQSTAANRWTQSSGAADPSSAASNTGFSLSQSITLSARSYTLIFVTARPPTVFAGFSIQQITQDHFIYTNKVLSTGGKSLPGVAQDGVNVWAISSGAEYADLYRNGAFMRTTVLDSATMTWSRLFAQNGGALGWKSPVVGAYIYNRPLSRNEIERVASVFGVHRKHVANYIGDSITTGSLASTFEQCFAARSAELSGRICINGGGAGRKTSDLAADPAMTNLFFDGLSNAYVYALGSNDLAANETAANTATRIQAHISALRTARPSARIVICTILPRVSGFSNGQDSAGFETQRQALNTSIKANYATWGANAVADNGGDSTIGPQSAASNTSLYPDGTHPSDSCHAVAAGIVATAIGLP